jgi:hypothetical protein
MTVRYEYWESNSDTWQIMLSRAKDRVDQVGPHRLISISHSQYNSTGVVVVWYWARGDYGGRPPRTPSDLLRRSSFHLIDSVDSWDSVFSQAANFATQIGPERLIGIWLTNGTFNSGVITIWYWLDEEEEDD